MMRKPGSRDFGIHGPYDGLHIGAWDGAVQRLVSERQLKALEFAEGLGNLQGGVTVALKISSR